MTPWLPWVEPQWCEVGRCVQNSQLLRHWKKATNAIDSTFQELWIWLMNARHVQEAQLAAEWHQKRSANTKDHREGSEYDDPWACWKCIFHTCQYHSAHANRLDDFKTLLDGKNWILWHLALDSERQRQNATNSLNSQENWKKPLKIQKAKMEKFTWQMTRSKINIRATPKNPPHSPCAQPDCLSSNTNPPTKADDTVSNHQTQILTK